MVLNILILFTGTDANGFTSKDHLEIGEKLAKFEDHYLQGWKLGKRSSNSTARNLTTEKEIGRELEEHIYNDSKICSFLESSCIKPIIDDHFKNSLASNASTGKNMPKICLKNVYTYLQCTEKNDSKPTEKPASALNLPKLSSKPTDIAK